MQQHLSDLHPLCADALKKFGRKVQSRRGRRCRAVLLGVHRLIALGVCKFFMDIGRQRHCSHAREDVLKRTVIHKFDDTFPRIGDRQHPEGEFFVDDEVRAGAALSAGTYEHLPPGQIKAFQEQHLHCAAMLGMRIDARRQHPRAVDDEHVPRLQIVDNVAEDFVFELPRVAVIDKQTGAVARLGWRLRDEFFGQIVIKITFFERFHICYAFSCTGFAVSCTHAGTNPHASAVFWERIFDHAAQ